MKDLITAIGSLLILTVFLMQAVGSQIIFAKLIRADMAIDNFRDIASKEGYISQKNTDLLENQLVQICDIEKSNIKVEGSSDKPAEKGELIHYKIEYYVPNIIVMNSFLNISDDENCIAIKENSGVVSAWKSEDE